MKFNLKKITFAYMSFLVVGAFIYHSFEMGYATTKEPVVIPDQAIRLRILANSDSDVDQKIKRNVRDAVNNEINKWVSDLTSFEESKHVIRQNLNKINEIVEKELAKQGIEETYKVSFGKVDFPTKIYGNYIYPAGEYDAVLITLGEGKGANWWCVLFPPLCFLDFSNGEAEKKEKVDEKDKKKEIEVKSLIGELIK